MRSPFDAAALMLAQKTRSNIALVSEVRITSYNVCYTKLLRPQRVRPQRCQPQRCQPQPRQPPQGRPQRGWKITSLSGEVGPSAAYANGKVFAVNEYAKFAAINPTNGTASELWESSEYLAEVSSPLAADNWVIVATSYGMAACYDQTNGEKLWENDFGEGFYSSPILADGKIYLADMGGTMHIMKAGNNFELIAEHDMGGKVFIV